MHTHACTHSCTHTHSCMNALTHVHAHTHTPTHAHTYTHTLMHECTLTHMCMHTFTHQLMHTYTHSYMYTHIQSTCARPKGFTLSDATLPTWPTEDFYNPLSWTRISLANVSTGVHMPVGKTVAQRGLQSQPWTGQSHTAPACGRAFPMQTVVQGRAFLSS